MAEGSTFAQARTQAQEEVLAAFGIDAEGVSGFDQMDISGTGESNAILLAVSAMLLQTATDRAADSESSVTAELSELLSTIATDISSDGELTSEGTRWDLCLASMGMDTGAIRANLEARYTALGAKRYGTGF